MASKRLRAFSLAHANLATTNSGSVQESRSGVMRGREMPDDILTFNPQLGLQMCGASAYVFSV
jgi:hypothetical protein